MIFALLGTCVLAASEEHWSIFDELGVVLPAPTELLLSVTGAVRKAWLAVVPAGLAAAWALWRYRPRRWASAVDGAAGLALFFLW